MENDLMHEFTESLRIKGRKADTITQYRAALLSFGEYLAACHIHSFFAAKEGDAYGWRKSLESGGCTRLTALKKMLCVHAFYQWLRESGRLLVNPFPRPSFSGCRRFPRNVPDRELVRRAFRSLRESSRLPELRDYVAVDLGYSCGLRRCELHGIDLQDIDTGSGTARVRGKGGRDRMVPIGERTMKDLLYYIYHIRPKLVKGSSTRALLVSWQKGGVRMNIRSINRAFIRIRRKYGFSDAFTPHGLRHAFATDLVKNGAPVQDVSEMLGHKKLETTQIYTRLAVVDLKKHHKMHHPRA